MPVSRETAEIATPFFHNPVIREAGIAFAEAGMACGQQGMKAPDVVRAHTITAAFALRHAVDTGEISAGDAQLLWLEIGTAFLTQQPYEE